MSICNWLIATAAIATFSAALVFIDPLTILADYLNERRRP